VSGIGISAAEAERPATVNHRKDNLADLKGFNAAVGRAVKPLHPATAAIGKDIRRRRMAMSGKVRPGSGSASNTAVSARSTREFDSRIGDGRSNMPDRGERRPVSRSLGGDHRRRRRPDQGTIAVSTVSR